MDTLNVIGQDTLPVVEVLGVTVQFLTPPDEAGYCMMRGTIPPAMSVPLHSHPDAETFFVLSGSVQTLVERDGRLDWIDLRPGDFVHIRGNVKHAHRNVSSEPVVEVVTTGATLGRFFQEVGRAVKPGVTLAPATQEDVRRVTHAAAKYGHWVASPDENAAAGLLPVPGS